MRSLYRENGSYLTNDPSSFFKSIPGVKAKTLQLAKMIVTECDPENRRTFWFGSRQPEEICFRLHRFIGALEFIGWRKKSANPLDIVEILDGTIADGLFAWRRNERKIIANIASSTHGDPERMKSF